MPGVNSQECEFSSNSAGLQNQIPCMPLQFLVRLQVFVVSTDVLGDIGGEVFPFYC